MAIKFNVFTGNLDLVLGDSYIDGKWLRLDTSNDPLTGELVITPDSGENALKLNKDLTMKAGEKVIYDG